MGESGRSEREGSDATAAGRMTAAGLSIGRGVGAAARAIAFGVVATVDIVSKQENSTKRLRGRVVQR